MHLILALLQLSSAWGEPASKALCDGEVHAAATGSVFAGGAMLHAPAAEH